MPRVRPYPNERFDILLSYHAALREAFYIWKSFEFSIKYYDRLMLQNLVLGECDKPTKRV